MEEAEDTEGTTKVFDGTYGGAGGGARGGAAGCVVLFPSRCRCPVKCCVLLGELEKVLPENFDERRWH